MTFTKKFKIYAPRVYEDFNCRPFDALVPLEATEFFTEMASYLKTKSNIEIKNNFDSEEEALNSFTTWVSEYLPFAIDYNKKARFFDSGYSTDNPIRIIIQSYYETI